MNPQRLCSYAVYSTEYTMLHLHSYSALKGGSDVVLNKNHMTAYYIESPFSFSLVNQKKRKKRGITHIIHSPKVTAQGFSLTISDCIL